MWGFATLGVVSKALLGKIASELEPTLPTLNAAELASTAWAFAVTASANEGFMSSIKEMTEAIADTMDNSHLMTICWALCKAAQTPDTLLSKLVAAVKDNVEKMTAQNLSELAWVLSQHMSTETELISQVASTLGSRVHELNARQLADVALAFGRLSEEKLMAQIAKRVEQEIDGFKPGEICTVAAALAPCDAVRLLPAFDVVVSSLKQVIDDGLLQPAELIAVPIGVACRILCEVCCCRCARSHWSSSIFQPWLHCTSRLLQLQPKKWMISLQIY